MIIYLKMSLAQVLNGSGWGRLRRLEQVVAILMNNSRKVYIRFLLGLKKFVGRMSLSLMKLQLLHLETV